MKDERRELAQEIEAEMEGRERGYADVRGELLFRCLDALRRQPSVEEVEAVLRNHIHRTSRVYSVRTGERKYGVGGYHEAAHQIAQLYKGEGG